VWSATMRSRCLDCAWRRGVNFRVVEAQFRKQWRGVTRLGRSIEISRCGAADSRRGMRVEEGYFCGRSDSGEGSDGAYGFG